MSSLLISFIIVLILVLVIMTVIVFLVRSLFVAVILPAPPCSYSKRDTEISYHTVSSHGVTRKSNSPFTALYFLFPFFSRMLVYFLRLKSNKSRKIIIFFHGNAQDIGQCKDELYYYSNELQVPLISM
jgi:hypothetical protein